VSEHEQQNDGALSLRVAALPAKDEGRGVVRLDPADVRRLSCEIGEVVQFQGQRVGHARVLPAFVAERGQSLIQLDTQTCELIGARPGDELRVRRVAVVPAQQVTLTPRATNAANGVPSVYELQQLLDGVPVLAGNQVRVALPAGEAHSFDVVATRPFGPVLIGAETTLELRGGATATPASVRYADIGGLHREVRRVREMIELPLRYPDLFARIGIAPPKGVLLHGPPGCGKTLIARAVAHETSATFLHVNGPEIIDQWYGSSEAQLRKVFEQAQRRAPAIIFLDEIDAIAPKRAEMSGERQVERRVVAQLLTLMDGLEARGNVVVIAATNIPDTLDPALRRPGRFDRELIINPPDADGRREILQIHARAMPLAPDVELDQLASVTHGFVGADLEALVREAAMNALRRVLPPLPATPSALSLAKLRALQVTNDDFADALTEVEPSALRDVHVDVPDVGWDDVGGQEEAKRVLRETVEWPLRHPQLFAQLGVRPVKGVLLHGPPGSGKTLLARALAKQSEANFIAIKGPQLLSRWVGESEQALRDLFRKARQAAPCVVFFDEIDALVPPRGVDASMASDRLVSQLLTELDGISELRGVVVVAATNRIDQIDEALLRPGRFDLLLELTPLDRAARHAILRVHTQPMPLAPDVRLAALADATDGFVGADLAGLCQQAALFALREAVAALGDTPGDAPPPAVTVTQAHFLAALDAQRNR
jgi:transitional endoplasmic reticulum ATPase